MMDQDGLRLVLAAIGADHTPAGKARARQALQEARDNWTSDQWGRLRVEVGFPQDHPHTTCAFNDGVFRYALTHGPPASLERYRHAYAAAGVRRSGEVEVRRRHRITALPT